MLLRPAGLRVAQTGQTETELSASPNSALADQSAKTAAPAQTRVSALIDGIYCLSLLARTPSPDSASISPGGGHQKLISRHAALGGK